MQLIIWNLNTGFAVIDLKVFCKWTSFFATLHEEKNFLKKYSFLIYIHSQHERFFD